MKNRLAHIRHDQYAQSLRRAGLRHWRLQRLRSVARAARRVRAAPRVARSPVRREREAAACEEVRGLGRPRAATGRSLLQGTPGPARLYRADTLRRRIAASPGTSFPAAY